MGALWAAILIYEKLISGCWNTYVISSHRSANEIYVRVPTARDKLFID